MSIFILTPAPDAITRYASHGFTLVEFLITLALTSVSITGILTLQQGALQLSAEATQRQQALGLAHDMLERARSAHGVRAADLSAWQQDVLRLLPLAEAQVHTQAQHITASLAWFSPFASHNAAHTCPPATARDRICLHLSTVLP